jgi:hypothetical protein
MVGMAMLRGYVLIFNLLQITLWLLGTAYFLYFHGRHKFSEYDYAYEAFTMISYAFAGLSAVPILAFCVLFNSIRIGIAVMHQTVLYVT